MDVNGFFYTVFVGFPLCVILCSIGAVLCITIIGIGPGLACIALGFKVLTLTPRPRIT